MNFVDPHGRSACWLLILSAVDFTVVHRPRMRNQGPEALSRCKYEIQVDKEVGDELPTLKDGRVLVTTREGAQTVLPKDEVLDYYDALD